MGNDFVKYGVHTMDLHIKVEYEYDLPTDFIMEEVASAINSKIRFMKVKEISVTQTEVRRIYMYLFK